MHHVREFPFLDKAREKEFWQDKLQVVSASSVLAGSLLAWRCSCRESEDGEAEGRTGTTQANEGRQFLQSFANKHISSSEDRLEETKRRKLSIKCKKLVELMMVSGIPTASGYEERIRFSELEVVDAGAIDHGVMNTLPEGHYTNGWDVNVSGVRMKSIKRNVRYHKHAVSGNLK